MSFPPVQINEAVVLDFCCSYYTHTHTEGGKNQATSTVAYHIAALAICCACIRFFFVLQGFGVTKERLLHSQAYSLENYPHFIITKSIRIYPCRHYKKY